MSNLVWGPLAEADLPGLASVARACLRRDGGLPLMAGEEMLREHYLSGPSIGGRDETGELVAVAGLFRGTDGRLSATGMVHPAVRHQGHGEALIAWAREQAGGTQPLVAAESVSVEAESLFARSGLRRVFAETVMRHDLSHIPRVPAPPGVHTRAFDDETAMAFHQAYRLSFADRPGFPDTPAAEWLRWVTQDGGFRPQDSRVAMAQDGEPVGFVILADDWLDQVGVVPAWRGRGLGAHLVVRSLTALRKAGCGQVWLCVSVDNAARALYERLGFVAAGTRARYEVRSPVEQPRT